MIELNKITDIKASMDTIQNAQSAIEFNYIPKELKENLAKILDKYIIELLWTMKGECSRLIMLHKELKKQKK